MVSSLDKKLEKVDLAQIHMERVMGLAGTEVVPAESLVTKLHTDIDKANMLVWELNARTPESQQLNTTEAIPAVSLNMEPVHFPQIRTDMRALQTIMQPADHPDHRRQPDIGQGWCRDLPHQGWGSEEE